MNCLKSLTIIGTLLSFTLLFSPTVLASSTGDSCNTGSDCPQGDVCEVNYITCDPSSDQQSGCGWVSTCQPDSSGVQYGGNYTCFACSSAGYCDWYKAGYANCKPGYSYDSNNCASCGGGGGAGGGCSQTSYSSTPPTSSYATANGAVIQITHLAYADGLNNYGNPAVTPFYKYYGSSHPYNGLANTLWYDAVDTSCQAGDDIAAYNDWSTSSGNTLTIQSVITNHTEDWNNGQTSPYQEQTGWSLSIQTAGYYFNSCSGPTTIGPYMDATSNFEHTPVYGTPQSYQVLGPSDCKIQTNLYVNPASGTSGSDVNGAVSPASATATQAIAVIATGTHSCSTNFTNPPTSGGGLAGCAAIVFACSGNPEPDGLPCWWQWQCNASATVGSYNVSFNSTQNAGCSSNVPLNISVPQVTGLSAYYNACTSEGKGSITVNWTQVPGATNYFIFRNGAGIISVSPSSSWTDSAASDTNPPVPGVAYTYQVLAWEGSAMGPVSSPSNSVTIPWTDTNCDTSQPVISSVTLLKGCYTPSSFPTIQITATDTGSGVASEKADFESPAGFSTGNPPTSWGTVLVSGTATNPAPQGNVAFTGTPPISYSSFLIDTPYYFTASASDVAGNTAYYPIAGGAQPNQFWVDPTCPAPFFQTYNGDVHANSNSGGGINVGP